MKKLIEEFSEFLSEGNDYENLQGSVAEFWSAKYGCNNIEKQEELLKSFLNNIS